jgi:uncharacterized protein (DUF1800 family)
MEERKLLRQKQQMANRQAMMQTTSWWLRRMAAGPHPLQEKLTLFWHGHFTTSAKDERSALLMWNQNELLRKHAAGNFKQFVLDISRDPAMLDYLNNQQNRKGHPNENYARELMELFTLGIGNYTEQDIKEAARAFTGWGHDGVQFVFRRGEHDAGPKTFFGHAGNFGGEEIIDLIFSKPVCTTYIASKFYNFFVNEESNDGICQALGTQMRDAKYELRPVLRTLLTSRIFYDPNSIGVQIKSPIQLVVGTVRMLGISMPPLPPIMGALNQMGQMPMMPPNVKGWPGGHAWINASTLFVRYNTAVRLAGGNAPIVTGRPAMDRREAGRPAPGFQPAGASTVDETVDQWVNRLIQRPIATDKRAILVNALDGRPDDPQAVRRMVQLIVSMPDFQLC